MNTNDLVIKLALSLLANRPKPMLHFLERHFGRRPDKFAIVRAEFPVFRHGCIELAMQNFLRQPEVRSRVIGVSSTNPDLSMRDLINLDVANDHIEGPMQYTDVALSDGSDLSCSIRALFLIRHAGKRMAVFTNHARYQEYISIEVLSPDRKASEEFLAYLRPAVDKYSIYRGKVLAMKDEHGEDWALRFQAVPSIGRNQLILPENIIEEIERQTLRFSAHSQLLRSRGQHLKRGLLLWGPPGTGKSLTIMYLIGNMPGRTTILVNSSSVKHLEDACQLAHALQPATVIIDDVDLIASKRTHRQSSPLLFELLSQMDGISEDSDVLFVLTTNRPEVLEPALASRPGRVDQAIMVPLPDDTCRANLFKLYSKELPISVTDIHSFIRKTDGVNAAFIRELFRKAALIAAEDGADQPITDAHLDKALGLLRSNALTSRLLGCSNLPQELELNAPKR
jgi:hypothetical protein